MPVIETTNLKKKYKDIIAVDNVSMSIERGEIFGILGPNGAGKSTLLFMLSTLIKPDEGEILFKGEDIIKNPKTLRPYLGLVPQDIALYASLSVKDNMYFWGGMYRLDKKKLKQRISEVLEMTGLEDKLDAKVETLSGGMKRRLNIAAALIHEPELIIMDEPTVGIDTESRAYIIDAVKKLKEDGATIIYTSHYITEVEELCDRIMIMKNGKMAALGTIDELRKQTGITEKAYKETGMKEPGLEEIYLRILKTKQQFLC